MKILVHGKTLRARPCGIRRYMVSLLHAMSQLEPGIDVRCSHLGLRARRVDMRASGTRIDFEERLERLVPRWAFERSGFMPLRKVQSRYRRAINACAAPASRRVDADLIWVPDPHLSASLQSGPPVVVSMYDLSHLHDVPGLLEAHRAGHSSALAENLGRAPVVTAISDWTRRDLIDRYGVAPDRIRIVPAAPDGHFRPITDRVGLEATRRRFDLPERFLLHVGSIQPRKGLVHLIRAHRRLLAEGHGVDLVLVGADSWLSDGILEEIDHPQSRARVHVRRNIPDAALPSVYNLADIFVMPSLLEGFGIPLIEAMACGIPAITTTASALPEVAGGAADLVAPGDDDALTRALLELLEDPARRRALRTAGLARAKAYSWERSARALLDAFGEVVGSQP